MSLRTFYFAVAVCVTPASLLAQAPPTVLRMPVVPGGLTADGAAARALSVSPQVRGATAESAQAEKTARWAVADFAPRLDLRASYTRLSEVEQLPLEFGGASIDNPFPQVLNHTLFRASISIPVTDYFLRVWPTYQALTASAEAASWQTETQRHAVALRAREAFYGFVRVSAGLQVADDAITLLEAHIGELKALFSAGQVTRADVMQATAQLADARGQRARLEGARASLEATLRETLHLDPDAALEIGEDVGRDLPPLAVTPSSLRAEALANRPEVQALEHVVRAQSLNERIAASGTYPSLSIVSNLDYASPNQRIIPAKDDFDPTWDISVILSWSPNTYVGARVRTDQAEVATVRATADLAQLKEGVAVQVAQAVSNYGVAHKQLEAAAEGVRAAEEAWRVQRDLLGAGEATPNDVLDAEAAHRRAQLALVDARIDLHLANTHIDHAVGRDAVTADGSPK